MSEQVEHSLNRMRLFGGVAYLMAVLLIVLPLSQVLMDLGTYDIGAVRWRFGAAGLITGTMLIPLAGLFLAAATAAARQHVWMLRGTVGITAIALLCLVGMSGLFLLDAIQLRREVTPQMIGRFDAVIIKTAFVQTAMGIFLVFLLIAGVRSVRMLKRSGRARGNVDAEDRGVLVRARPV